MSQNLQGGTYSFLDVQASIIGPGGSFALGSGAGNAEEGITTALREEKNTLTIGADGSAMNSLHAGQGGKITIRLLKTSPVNAQLSQMYNLQKQSSAAWGLNVISVKNPISGDSIVGTYCAFEKHPDINYAKEAGMIEWDFSVGILEQTLGGTILTNLVSFGAGSV